MSSPWTLRAYLNRPLHAIIKECKIIFGFQLGLRTRPRSVPARQRELSSRWLVCWRLLAVHGCKWATDGLRELSLVAATLVGSVDGDVASWGERRTRISAEMADVKRVVVLSSSSTTNFGAEVSLGKRAF